MDRLKDVGPYAVNKYESTNYQHHNLRSVILVWNGVCCLVVRVLVSELIWQFGKRRTAVDNDPDGRVVKNDYVREDIIRGIKYNPRTIRRLRRVFRPVVPMHTLQ